MSDRTQDLLVRGIAAAKGKSDLEAVRYLEWVIDAPDSDEEQIIEAWRYLARVNVKPQARRECLEQVLAHNPMDPEARRELAILNGELRPEEIVDPDHMPAPGAAQPVQARRYVCAKCGGKMAFTPDGGALACEYCNRRQSLLAALDTGAMVEEDNFAVALATAKGHTQPVSTQSIKCQGCGASFAFQPETLSKDCPYCGSAYVVERSETRELIPPQGIVPFAVTQDQAQQIVFDWYRAEGFKVLSSKALPGGVYLPAWTFDLGGEVRWGALVERSQNWSIERKNNFFDEAAQWESVSGAELVYENDMLVAASHTLSAALIEEISAFPLDHLVPYDTRYLSDWPAETYQISVSDASLVARERVMMRLRPHIEVCIARPFKDLHLGGTRLVIEAYRLILLPLWIARYRVEGKWYSVVVNGQTGKLRCEKPRKGVGGWLSSLLGD
jgi:DNA-directed RNA polymerase subunit RPC12/RpoP